jgi:MSHA biogenesis protein MshQ
MRRQLVLLALCAGCGNVNDPVPPDAAPPVDVLTGSLRTGCVLALHMDEPSWSGASGEVKDACGDDNPGTLVGQGNTVPNGAHGRAGSFSGNACIDIQNAETLHGATGLTLSAWILPTKLNHGSDANGILSKRTSGNNQNEYSMAVWLGDHLYVDIDGESDRFPGNAVILENLWTQVTVVYDGTQAAAQRARVYLNGTLDVTKLETSAILTKYPSTLHVGCMPAPTAPEPTQQNFIGELDEVAIWNRALTDAEITQWYTATRPAP